MSSDIAVLHMYVCMRIRVCVFVCVHVCMYMRIRMCVCVSVSVCEKREKQGEERVREREGERKRKRYSRTAGRPGRLARTQCSAARKCRTAHEDQPPRLATCTSLLANFCLGPSVLTHRFWTSFLGKYPHFSALGLKNLCTRIKGNVFYYM